MKHEWPGNVRELENMMERALIQCREGILMFEEPSSFIQEDWLSRHGGRKMKPLKLDEMTSIYIKKILESTNGKISGPDGAAELLGLPPSTLRKKMDKLGIAFRRR